MKILIVDREGITAQLMKARLEPLGHQIKEETSKNNAVELLANERFDMIFVDPMPLTSARPVILNIRRASSNYPYVLHMATEGTQIEAIQSGANDFIAKPIDPESLDKKVESAKRLTALIKRIGDDKEDFPSAGGIIAKSAFNQLFLSAIDRADRYGERTYIVFIRLSNYQDIAEREGPYAADYAVAKLSQYLVRLRRQSDIIAQTERFEYALLLQRPLYETEPEEAANRFAEAVAGFKDFFAAGEVAPEVTVKLVDLPVGSQIVEHYLTKDSAKR
ncbi:MAG: response regulator [Alphaproteobacteria bacterium]|nr:response regulator [Alphaproteobacteria bacterium]MBP7758057.1 response regulator [Alphaproteobacteria bacterium]MBP7761510.1 response regulator [Alphaproteobacteria bacterium]MBP7906153.1 response regulator [Alphaproteobacteria bacterium]